MTCDYPPAAQGYTVTCFDDAHLTGRDDDCFRERDGEKQCVDSIGAGRDQPDLGTPLPTVLEERGGVLKCVAGHQLRDDPAAWQRFSIASLDATDLAWGHGKELDQFNLVLPGP